MREVIEAIETPAVQHWLTVVETVYFQAGAGTPVYTEARFARLLASEEQPYQRVQKVGQEWQALDAGWLAGEGASLLVLANEFPQWRVVPTPDERLDAMAKVVEVCIGERSTPFAFIRPGEDCRFEPSDLTALRLRCRHGETKITATLIPL